MKLQLDPRKWSTKLRRIAMVIVILILLPVVLYEGRGIIRSNMLPAYATWRHKSQITSDLQREQTVVNQAIKPLGISFNQSSSGDCELDIAQEWRAAVNCYYSINSNAPSSSLYGNTALLQQVDRALRGRGLSGDVDYSSPGSIQLTYNQNNSGTNCSIQIYIDQPGDDDSIPGQLECDHDYYYFGNPYNHLD